MTSILEMFFVALWIALVLNICAERDLHQERERLQAKPAKPWRDLMKENGE